jgi:hypothetical protein
MEAPLDEVFDTQREVERNPCGAWQAIQTLAARLAEVEHVLQNERRTADWTEERAKEYMGRMVAAEARAERLEAALRFYADERLDGYDVAVTDYGLSTEEGHIIRDGGEIARAALQQEGGE